MRSDVSVLAPCSLGVKPWRWGKRLISRISEPSSRKWQNFLRMSWHYPGGILERTEEAAVWGAGWKRSGWCFCRGWVMTENQPMSADQEAGGGYHGLQGPELPIRKRGQTLHEVLVATTPPHPEANSASHPEPWPRRQPGALGPSHPPVTEPWQGQVSSLAPGCQLGEGMVLTEDNSHLVLQGLV